MKSSAPSRLEYLSLYVKLLMGLTVVVCGIAGFVVDWQAREVDAEAANEWWPDQVFYRTVQLFVLNSGTDADNPWLAVARGTAAILFVWIAFAAIRKLFADSWAGLQMQVFANDHDVVCGLGAAGAELATQVQSANAKRWGWVWRLWRLRPSVVAVEADPDNFAANQVRSLGGVVLLGDATDPATLQRAGIGRAARVFVATGNDEANVQIVFDLIQAFGKNGRHPPLQCYVHAERPGVAGLLDDSVIDAALERGIDVRVFSAARQSAGELVVSDLALKRPDLERGERDSLYVLLGFGPLGQAAAIEIAQLAHFENNRRPAFVIAAQDAPKAADRFLAEFGAFSPRTVRKRSELTLDDVVGEDGEKCDWRCDELRDGRYPGGERIGVRYAATAVFVEAPPHYNEHEFLDSLRRLVADERVVPSILVCLENGREGFDVAMRLARTLGPTVEREISIYVWLPKQTGFVAYLEGGAVSDARRSIRIVPFGDCRGLTSLERIADAPLDRLARALHEDYRANSAHQSRRSSRPWEKLEPTFRRSNYDAARHAMVKLQVAGLIQVPRGEAPRGEQTESIALDESLLETLAKMEHCRWMAERLLDGWRYGREQNDDRLERPQLVPWEELPPEERAKDRRQVEAVLRILNQGESRLVHARSAAETRPVESSSEPSSLDAANT